jgi:hypothetical protein
MQAMKIIKGDYNGSEGKRNGALTRLKNDLKVNTQIKDEDRGKVKEKN